MPVPEPLDYAKPKRPKPREHVHYEGLGFAGILLIIGIVSMAVLFFAGIVSSC
jgi:hypothetical protein